MQVDKQCQRTQ